MADHYRAAADMVVRWALSESSHCNVEIAECLDGMDRRLLTLLNAVMPKLGILNKQEKVSAWLHTQPLG
jgi:hypothetical protein